MMHDFHLNHLLPASQGQTENATPPKKTMTPAALDANRANAAKSTGPRTPDGKARSASNSFKHGLYSLRNFHAFYQDNNLAQSVMINFQAQFMPVTPAEHAILHQLVHFQLRFLYMEHLFGLAMNNRCTNPLAAPDGFLLALFRELDRLPTRVQRTIKLLREEISRRERETCEIEPIPDPEPLPTCPAPENCVANLHYTNTAEAGRILYEREVLPILESLRNEAIEYHRHCKPNEDQPASGAVPSSKQ